jgi:hypothetical protein
MKKAVAGLMILLFSFLFVRCEKKDTIPPTVEITNPANNSIVVDTVLITVDANDNTGVDRVEFYIDTSKVATDTAAPWEYSWNTAGLTDSSYHRIVVTVFDQADNSAADTVTVLYWTNRVPNTPSNPFPADGAANQSTATTFVWHGGDPDSGDVVTYALYLGVKTDSAPPLFKDSISDTTFLVNTLTLNTVYQWQVVARDNHGSSASGPNWSFTTSSNQPPNVPSNPSPADGAIDQPSSVTLSWTGGDPDTGDTVKYEVYFGTTTTPVKVDSNLSAASYKAAPLDNNKTYYWKIVARDNKGDTIAGPVWRFTTLVQWPEVEIMYDNDRYDVSWYKITSNPHAVNDKNTGWSVRMTPPAYPFTLTKAKIYFTGAAHNFYLHVWDDNFAGGKPGSDLLHTPYSIDATSVPSMDWWIRDVALESVTVTAGDFYVGFCYSYLDTSGAPSVSIAADTSAPIDDRSWTLQGGMWQLFTNTPRSDLLIRAIGYIGGKAAPKKEIEIFGKPVPINGEETNAYIRKNQKK